MHVSSNGINEYICNGFIIQKLKIEMERRVVITGLGTISPVGNTVAEFWDSLVQGKSGLNFIQGFDDVDLPVRIVAQVKNFDPMAHGLERADIRKMDLYCQYAIAAANQAVQDSGLVSGENIEPDRFGVYVGSGIGGISTFVRETNKYTEEGARRVSPLFVPTMIANIASGNIAIRHNAQGPCLPVVTACATGTHSVGEAYHAIKCGMADAIITGGAEAAIHPLAIGGFANSRALTHAETLEDACTPFDARRSGFTMADGAGVLILEEYEHALQRGATIYAGWLDMETPATLTTTRHRDPMAYPPQKPYVWHSMKQDIPLKMCSTSMPTAPAHHSMIRPRPMPSNLHSARKMHVRHSSVPPSR